MSHHRKCCCGGDSVSCCDRCAQNCRVIDLGGGVGNVRVRMFVTAEFTGTREEVIDCPGSSGTAQGSAEWSYSIDEEVEALHEDVPVNGDCGVFEVNEVVEFPLSFSAEHDGDCGSEQPPPAGGTDWAAIIEGSVSTNGGVSIGVRIGQAPVGITAEGIGALNLLVSWRRETFSPDACVPFINDQCGATMETNLHGVSGFPEYPGGFAFTDPDLPGWIEVTGLDSTCHGDITITLGGEFTTVVDQEFGPGGSITRTDTAEFTATIRLLVEGLEACDVEQPMQDLPDSCHVPPPEPEPEECCDVDDACRPISTANPPTITLGNIFARVMYILDTGASCDDGNPATPPATSNFRAGWHHAININSLTLLPVTTSGGCPVYQGEYSITEPMGGEISGGCSGGAVAPANPGSSVILTLRARFTYRPAQRRLSMLLELDTAGAPFGSLPILTVYAVLDPASSPVWQQSYARSRTSPFEGMTHGFEIPDDWSITSWEPDCHTAMSFGGNGETPTWYDDNHGAFAIVGNERFAWAGSIDLEGLEACAA